MQSRVHGQDAQPGNDRYEESEVRGQFERRRAGGELWLRGYRRRSQVQGLGTVHLNVGLPGYILLHVHLGSGSNTDHVSAQHAQHT